MLQGNTEIYIKMIRDQKNVPHLSALKNVFYTVSSSIDL